MQNKIKCYPLHPLRKDTKSYKTKCKQSTRKELLLWAASRKSLRNRKDQMPYEHVSGLTKVVALS